MSNQLNRVQVLNFLKELKESGESVAEVVQSSIIDRLANLGVTQIQEGMKLSAVPRDFQDSVWVGCDFSGLDLSMQSLETGLFLQCSFKQTLLQDTSLSGAIVAGCDFGNADLFYATLFSAICRGSRFTGANLDQCTLEEVDMSEAVLSGVDFRNCIIPPATSMGGVGNLVFDNALMLNAKLDGLNLEEASFVNVKALSASFVRSRLQYTNLTDADFQHADLRNANLAYAKTDGAKFDGAQLEGVYGLTDEEEDEDDSWGIF